MSGYRGKSDIRLLRDRFSKLGFWHFDNRTFGYRGTSIDTQNKYIEYPALQFHENFIFEKYVSIVTNSLSSFISSEDKNVGRDNVKIIQGAITDKKKIDISWDNISESVPTFTFKEFLEENNIKHIDFLKCDCEGGEYDVFQQSNIEFLKTIPKIVTEFHLRDDESVNRCKFRWFRDNILTQFDNIQVFSVDGVDIKWDLWNEHFIEYYNEVIVYMDNR